MTEQSGRGERHLSRKDFLKYSLASGVVWAGSQGVENFVVVTGDIHSYIAGYVRENYDDPTPPVLETEAEPEPNPLNRLAGTCFVCGSVTSSNLVELVTGSGNGERVPQVREGLLNTEDGLSTLQSAFQETSNPHIEFFDSSAHGYNLMEVTPEKLVCTMIAVETTQQNQSDRYVLARFEVPDGLVRIMRTDVVPAP